MTQDRLKMKGKADKVRMGGPLHNPPRPLALRGQAGTFLLNAAMVLTIS